jgi:hypothetical protein
MVATYNERTWLQAKLTSTSIRDVRLNLVELQMNPEFESFIKLVQKVSNLEDGIVLKTGESFECLFEIDVGNIPDEESLTSSIMGEGEVSRS